MDKPIKTYDEFYQFYLKEHQNPINRMLHVIGTTIVLALTLTAILHFNPYWLIFVPISGYGFAWIGHFFFEKNQPATFKYPFWSLKSDFKMYFDILNGKVPLNPQKN
ncbi:MAG TPA: DUF962 domain-containing protein [Flavobacteriia bacterium]|nr:DUF962 domain-containing protein [Flavobacteriia bacterium]